MRSRREILGWMSAGAATAALPTMVDSETDKCRSCADDLAEAMKRRHGGNWAVKLDHDLKVAMVFGVASSQPSE